MNAYILNCFIKDKAEKVPKTQSPTHELMKQLKNIEKQKRVGDKYNILVEAYNSIYTLYNQKNTYIDKVLYLINCTYNILSISTFELRTDDKKIYTEHGIYYKNDITQEILTKSDSELASCFEKFYDALYNYVDQFDFLKDSLLYLWILRTNNHDTYNKLTQFHQLDPLQTIYGTKYRVINGKTVFLFDDELYELNIDTLKRLLKINNNSDDILNKYIKCLNKEIQLSCCSIPLSKDIRPLFKYLYPGQKQYMLILDQGKASVSLHDDTIFYKPIHLNESDLQAIRNGYTLDAICRCLQVISNNNYTIIAAFAKLLADCLLPYPQSKKIYVVNVKNECDIEIIKNFIKRILSHGNGSTCVIDKNLTINEVCKNYALLDELKYTRLYALFLEQGSSEINAQQMLLIYNLITKTSNNAKNSNKNNIQPILFQSTGEIPEFIKPKNIEYIDVSMSQLDEQINNLSSEECCWIRLYLSLYGLHLILKSQKSNLNFDLGCKLEVSPTKKGFSETSIYCASREEFISCITSDFLERYFVSVEEAGRRKAERTKRIKDIKKQYKDSPNLYNILTEKLSAYPLFETTKNDLEIYIKTYIETQCESSLIIHFKVTEKDIYQKIISNEIYKVGEINAQYAGQDHGKKLGRGIQNLSIKELWPITKAKMEQTNINTAEDSDIKPTEIPKPASFDDPIDENLLEFLTSLNNAVKF